MFAAAVGCTIAMIAPASAWAAYSEGTHEQVEWVRRAASNFVGDELAGNGAGACAILNAPLRRTEHGRSCAQRWNARLARLRHEPGVRSRLRSDQHAIARASVIVHGNTAAIALPHPLANGPNHFLWTENCWMLEG